MTRSAASMIALAALAALGGCYKKPPGVGLTGPGTLDVTVQSLGTSYHCTYVLNQAPTGVTMNAATGEIDLHGFAGVITWTVDLNPSLGATWPADGFDAIWVKLGSVPQSKTYQAGFSPQGSNPTVTNNVLTVQINNLNNGSPPGTIWGYRLNPNVGATPNQCDPRIVNR